MANIEKLAGQLPGVAVGAVAAGAATYFFSPDLPAWAIDIIKQVGPFAVLLLVAMWYVPRGAVREFIGAQQGQAVALSGIKDAMQAVAHREVRIEEQLTELNLNQRVTITRLERIESLIINGHQSAKS